MELEYEYEQEEHTQSFDELVFQIVKIAENKAFLQLEYKLKPKFLQFSKDKAAKIAHRIRPLTFLVITAITALVAYLCSISLWFLIGIGLLAIPFIYFATLTLRQAYYDLKVKQFEDNIDMNQFVQSVDGPPGTGKTSSSTNRAVLMAKEAWNEILDEYSTLEPFMKDIPFWPEQDKLDAEEIIETYNYYQETKTFPCLWSSVPLFVDGVKVNEITAAHLLQKEKLPYNSVIFLDEVNHLLPNYLYKATPMELMEMLKYPRHFGNFRFICADQSSDGSVIYIRRSSSQNMYLTSQEWILQPRLLLWIYRWKIRHIKVMTKSKVNELKMLMKVIKNTGYRKYTYILTGTEKIKQRSEEMAFYLNSSLNCEYDDRAMRNAYRCKNQPLKYSAWEKLVMTEEDVKKVYSQDIQNLVENRKVEKWKKERELKNEERKKEQEKRIREKREEIERIKREKETNLRRY